MKLNLERPKRLQSKKLINIQQFKKNENAGKMKCNLWLLKKKRILIKDEA